jgi:hypothetical protein
LIVTIAISPSVANSTRLIAHLDWVFDLARYFTGEDAAAAGEGSDTRAGNDRIFRACWSSSKDAARLNRFTIGAFGDVPKAGTASTFDCRMPD